MEHIITQKRSKRELPAQLTAKDLQAAIAKGLSSTAGISKLRERDPVYELTECFQASFKQFAVNDRQAGQKSENSVEKGSGTRPPQAEKKSNRNTFKRDFPSFEHAPAPSDEAGFYSRFSQVAFNNGRMSGAVMQGEEKTMFISCLQRACGVPFRPNDKQKTLFASSAADVPVENYAARLRFNEWTHGAAGIVVDSLMNADTLLSLLETLASDRSSEAIEGNDVDIYRCMFPFLSIKKETEMLELYENAIQTMSKDGVFKDSFDVDERLVLTHGLKKTRAMINRKRQMKSDFLVRLRELLLRSREARELLSSPLFLQEASAQAFEPPPEDTGTADDNNRQDPENKNADETKQQ
jgi:hypothetical protein